MIRVAFVCLGNICRSPMAELIFKKMLKERGLSHAFEVTSCGTSSCEAGSPVYPPALKTLRLHGVEGEHTARKVTREDISRCDYLLVMDEGNLRDLRSFAGDGGTGKIFMLRSFTPRPSAVADPWYTRDFERAYADIEEGCGCFLDWVVSHHSL